MFRGVAHYYYYLRCQSSLAQQNVFIKSDPRPMLEGVWKCEKVVLWNPARVSSKLFQQFLGYIFATNYMWFVLNSFLSKCQWIRFPHALYSLRSQMLFFIYSLHLFYPSLLDSSIGKNLRLFIVCVKDFYLWVRFLFREMNIWIETRWGVDSGERNKLLSPIYVWQFDQMLVVISYFSSLCTEKKSERLRCNH